MKNRKFLRAVIGFVGLCIVLFAIYVIDFAILYSIFIYFQFLLAPFLTGIGYLFYVARLSIPYICMYILICLFFNIQTYKTNSTIKLLKYTIDINAVRRSKLYIYLREYNYVFIIAFNLFLLFIVYYAYVNNKYFYLLFVFLFYLFIWIIIKIKQWLLKNETLQYKKIHMLVNVILVVLIGTYISMALEDLHISNTKLYGFENFWKLIDNKYFLKMPAKDLNWNRVFNWSKKISTDRYMYDFKKGIIKSQFMDKASLSQNIKNDDLNLNTNSNLSDYLNRMHYKDQNLSKFSNALYQKFKKVFLIQLQIKSANFKPTPEINERHKLLNWLKNPRHFVDLAQWYTPDESSDSSLYDNYLDLIDKKFDNLTTKKVFLITLHKNYFSLKDFAFYADFEQSFKKNYMIFLNTEKHNIDLKNNSILNFEYYNSDSYSNFEFNNLWINFENELYMIFKENEEALSLFKMKFKSLYTLKKFKFSFKDDVLDENDNEILLDMKPKKKTFIRIPDYKKLQIWKTFKLNYKEFIFNHTRERKHIKFSNFEDKWLSSSSNKLKILKEPLNELYFIVDEDVAYALYENKLEQVEVEDLEFNLSNLSTEQYDALNEYISYYLENVKTRSKALELASTRKLKKVFINDLNKTILELQNNRHHIPSFYSMYHEILLQNSNKFFKSIIENSILFRDLLTCSRSFMTHDMWFNLMQKLLNLNKNSFCLNNLKDFSDFCKSDFTEDLQFNFSLAFDIMQSKYDLNKFLMIPDLEGIPGSFYEYTVKYNAHMARYYWYEEQEELIDWIYEISYYALVNIMDTVKEVNYKENDFLYDMINEHLRDPNYKWAAELFNEEVYENDIEQLQPTELYKALNNQLDAIDELKHLYQLRNEMILNLNSDKHYIETVEERSLLDFDDIKTIKQFNIKLKRDILVIDYIFQWYMHNVTGIYSEIAEDFEDVHHIDFHNEHMLTAYEQIQEELNFELGKIGGIGMYLNEIYVPEWDIPEWDFIGELFSMDDFMEHMDLTWEFKKSENLDLLFHEMEDLMDFEYEHYVEMEGLDEWVEDECDDLFESYLDLIDEYNDTADIARARLLGELHEYNDDKQNMIDNFQDELLDFDLLNSEIEILRLIELNNMYLNQLPIFDWSTHTYIQENIDLLNHQNADLLKNKFNELEVLLKKEKIKLAEMAKIRKLYDERVRQHAMEEPGTKRYLDKNWDDYNYLSNKSDKLMSDWFKKKK